MQTTPREARPSELAAALSTDGARAKTSEFDFRIIAETSLSLIVVADHTGIIQYVNPTFCASTGFFADEVVGRRIHDLGSLDAETLAELWNTLGFGQPWHGECAATTSEGRELWIRSSVSPVKDEGGQVTHFIAVGLDISERKRAEEALRENEEMFRTLAETTPASTFIFDGARVVWANEAAGSISGYLPDELKDMDLRQMVSPEHLPRLAEMWQAVRRGENSRATIKIRNKDGVDRSADFAAALVHFNGKPAILCTARDITAEREAAEALAASEEKFRSLVETSREIVWAIDNRLRVTYVNPTIQPVMGYQPEDLLGRNCLDLLHPDDLAEVSGLLIDALGAGEGWSATTNRWMCKDGTWRYVESGGAPVFSPDGAVAGFRGVARDVTDRQLAEQARRQSEERYRLLYQDNPSMYFTLAEDLSVISVNQHGAEQLGYLPDDLVGRPVFLVVHPDDQTSVRRQLESLLRHGGDRQGIEFRKVRKDGEVMWVKEHIRVTQDADGRRIVLVVCEDISDLKRMEEAIQGLREDLERKAECAVAGENPYSLSFRELTVLHLVAGGRSDKEIGVVLGIRPQTVSKHVANVLRKMRASSRTEAGVRALREGLIA